MRCHCSHRLLSYVSWTCALLTLRDVATTRERTARTCDRSITRHNSNVHGHSRKQDYVHFARALPHPSLSWRTHSCTPYAQTRIPTSSQAPSPAFRSRSHSDGSYGAHETSPYASPGPAEYYSPAYFGSGSRHNSDGTQL